MVVISEIMLVTLSNFSSTDLSGRQANLYENQVRSSISEYYDEFHSNSQTRTLSVQIVMQKEWENTDDRRLLYDSSHQNLDHIRQLQNLDITHTLLVSTNVTVETKENHSGILSSVIESALNSDRFIGSLREQDLMFQHTSINVLGRQNDQSELSSINGKTTNDSSRPKDNFKMTWSLAVTIVCLTMGVVIGISFWRRRYLLQRERNRDEAQRQMEWDGYDDRYFSSSYLDDEYSHDTSHD